MGEIFRDLATSEGERVLAMEARISRLEAALKAADLMEHFASKAVFEDGYTERLLIENWPLMDALAQYREARALLSELQDGEAKR